MLWMLPALLVSASYSPHSLAVELRAMRKTPAAHVPESWRVETREGAFTVSSAGFTELRSKDPDAATEWLRNMARQLDGYASYAPARPALESAGLDRASLERILSQPEFLRAAHVSEWQLFKQRMMMLFLRLLQKLFGKAAEQHTAAWVIFAVVFAGAVAILWFWIADREKSSQPRIAPHSDPLYTERAWRAWAQLARDAAAAGNLRNAIHCCYWTAATLLREREPRTARSGITPREYLRLFNGRSDVETPLAALTRALERFWYAGRDPIEAEFNDAKEHLRSLGCPLD